MKKMNNNLEIKIKSQEELDKFCNEHLENGCGVVKDFILEIQNQGTSSLDFSKLDYLIIENKCNLIGPKSGDASLVGTFRLSSIRVSTINPDSRLTNSQFINDYLSSDDLFEGRVMHINDYLSKEHLTLIGDSYFVEPFIEITILHTKDFCMNDY